ncbi:hypothetical protein MtrunA17_Chr4g0024061 [Medicago truncatula]|uniref:FRIGIDA-like protein n=1 Tax=Medicago truncatula TaxID=3880 RepID=A0A396I7P6_MEDTR|nr:hypothetical protein MtrunA17_Chr4g0024061 [Medicago truncatula]
MKPPHSIREDCKALRRELEWHENSIHRWRIKSRAVEKHLKFVKNEIKLYSGDLYAKLIEFDCLTRSVDEKEQLLQTVEHELNAKRREFDILAGLIKERNYDADEKEKRLREKARDIENQYKHIKSKHQEIEEREKDHQTMEEQFEEKEKAHEGKVKYLESRFVELQEFESRIQIQHKEQEEKFEEREKDLRSKEEQFVEQENAHKDIVECLESKFVELRELESIFKEREKALCSNEEDYDKQLDVLVSIEKESEEREKELFWDENLLKQRLKYIETKQKEFEDQEKQFKLREKHLETKEKQSEDRERFNLVKQLEFICSQFSAVLRASSDPAKLVLESIKGCCPSHVRNLLVDELYKTSPVISLHVKEEAIKFATEWKENLSVLGKDNLEVLNYFKFVATFEIGSSCQAPRVLCGPVKVPGYQPSFTTNDGGNVQLLSDRSELNDNGILVNLQTAPNPAQLVLDMIRNPKLRQEEGMVIEKRQIFLLDQLTRISPHIDCDVKYEAMKLALELKDTARGCAENSLLFEVVAHHKEAVELFQTLGFEDKISDFVDNLIKNLRHIGAVRFISAYNLADKSRLVSIMLQIEMEKAKQISYEVVCREKHREPKVKARDTEIASLRDILQCISDCNLEYHHNLVGEIKKRIFVLEQENQRENSVAISSESLSNEKKRARKEVSTNQVKEQELAQKKPYDVAGTKNPFRVQHREEKQPQVEMRQSQVRKHVDEQEGYQLSLKFGNIKRLRTMWLPLPT